MFSKQVQWEFIRHKEQNRHSSCDKVICLLTLDFSLSAVQCLLKQQSSEAIQQ